MLWNLFSSSVRTQHWSSLYFIQNTTHTQAPNSARYYIWLAWHCSKSWRIRNSFYRSVTAFVVSFQRSSSSLVWLSSDGEDAPHKYCSSERWLASWLSSLVKARVLRRIIQSLESSVDKGEVWMEATILTHHLSSVITVHLMLLGWLGFNISYLRYLLYQINSFLSLKT